MSYSIVRSKFQQGGEVIQTGLSLAAAQEHCSRPDTHGDGWFDGYREYKEYPWSRIPGLLEQAVDTYVHVRGSTKCRTRVACPAT